MKHILLSIAIISATLLKAQTSIFQDSKGEAAYKVLDNALTLNTKDKSIAASFNTINNSRKSNTEFYRLGLNLKLNANESISTIKNSEGFLVDGEFGIYMGWKTTTDPADLNTLHTKVSEFYISSNVLIDRNKFYQINRPKDDFTYSEGSIGWKLEVGNFGYYDNWIFGLSINGGQTNNLNDLKSHTVSEVVQNLYNDSISIQKETSAYNYDQFSNGLWTGRLNADIGLLINPNNSLESKVPQIYVAGLLRYITQESSKPKFNPAIGIYLGKNIGDPSAIVMGINFQLLDAFNVESKDNTVFDRSIINVVAGYNF